MSEATPQEKTRKAGDHRGGDQSRLRQYNERLILHLVRQSDTHGDNLSKADIARLTQLSAQAVSIIVNRLLEEELLAKQPKVRGKVGQPSTPIALNPDGAYGLGVKIGRRGLSVVMMGLDGEIRDKREIAYDYPTPEAVVDHICDFAGELRAGLPQDRLDRLVGMGVAAPGELEKWTDVLHLPADAMAGWRDFNLVEALEARGHENIVLINDVTAACEAELAFGAPRNEQNRLYIFIGAFVGGGVIINQQVYAGPSGNAGALGSMPVSDQPRGEAPYPPQLIDDASLIRLEDALSAAGCETPASVIASAARDEAAQAKVDEWRRRAAHSLAHTVASAISVIDFESVTIDGALPEPDLRAIIEETEQALERFNPAGVTAPRFHIGRLGADARALGAAFLPLKENYALDSDPFHKARG